ncbi:hypothetical protein Drorol1_Dr00021832 [Drosera rotundifolia]
MAATEIGETKPSSSSPPIKEGTNMLGSPTFDQLENGRFRCKETGHELPGAAIEEYSNSKGCRVGLIDFAVKMKKPPLNMFKQDPTGRSKLICKLTGDTINKFEEHIWKHINGKHFLKKLEEMEAGKLTEKGASPGKSKKMGKEESTAMKQDKKEKKKKQEVELEKTMEEIVTEVREPPNDSDSEEPDFWEPPVGERWDFDVGGDRWGSDSEPGEEYEEEHATDDADEDTQEVSAELSNRTKRMSIEIGPSSFASRKKKIKTKPTC